MHTKMVHISTIKPGDTVIHNGVEQTVCESNIKHSFMGPSLFGDSYRNGSVLVVKVIYTTQG